MGLSKIYSVGLVGLDGYMIEVEADVSQGLPSFDIVGLPDAAVKESKERVRSAISNVGFEFPLRRVTINLAPGDIKKEGPGFDLPIALAILITDGQIQVSRTEEYIFFGELSLDGSLRPVNGALPMALSAKEKGVKKVILPTDNAKEAGIVKGMEVFAADSITDVINHLTGTAPISPTEIELDSLFIDGRNTSLDFADVKGQANVKRALEIAAAGGHNCCMIGSPGSGKTMLAQRLPSILPEMSFDESVEVTKIHSVAGVLPKDIPLITTRPFRSPHHTTSSVSLAGGGRMPRPGEISLAHNGVLFLDELPEFKKEALEVLRQPIEDGVVNISRVNAAITYPCNFMLVAAMNPCPCGYFGDPKRRCICTPAQIHKYLGKISGPMLDRIDLHIDVAPVEYSNLTSTVKEESSAEIRKRVNMARQIQLKRYEKYKFYSNAQLTARLMDKFCVLGENERSMLKAAFEKMGLTARAYSRIVKVSRTIADLEGAENINTSHIAEALQYRTLDRKFYR
ncbi:MAG: YifB family Mg chelatase-like AAA ATPase [Bacillota bacterium]|nr:YifB family Mg chelatase-like AAA ATPase [Bacillota bacterium]